MIKNIPYISFRFILMVILQVFVLNKVAFNGYINPYLYVLFIILLPFETPAWLSLLLSFLLGLSIDIFSGTIGMNITACLFMAYIRNFLLNLLSPRDGYEFGLTPTLQSMGLAWFAVFSGLLTFSHHAFLFLAEAFRLSEFFPAMGRAILSSIFTITLIFLSQLLVYRPKKF